MTFNLIKNSKAFDNNLFEIEEEDIDWFHKNDED
jgi:hypothetical protein